MNFIFFYNYNNNYIKGSMRMFILISGRLRVCAMGVACFSVSKTIKWQQTFYYLISEITADDVTKS